jgi:hypothetical protein
MLVVVLNDGETYTDIEGCRVIDSAISPGDPMFDVVIRNQYSAGQGTEVLDLVQVYESIQGSGA